MNQPIDYSTMPFKQVVGRLVYYAVARITKDGLQRGIPESQIKEMVQAELNTYFCPDIFEGKHQ